MPADLVTDTERDLAAMWTDVLGAGTVGRSDNFFDLGGDSMLATVLVLSARRAFQVEISVRVLFDSPVLKDLAGRIDVLIAGGDRPRDIAGGDQPRIEEQP